MRTNSQLSRYILALALLAAGGCNHAIKSAARRVIPQDTVAAPTGLAFEPAALDFGRVIAGTTQSQAVRITNTSGAPVTFTINPVQGVDLLLFSTTPGAGSGVTVLDQESQVVTVVYAPQVASSTSSQASFSLQRCVSGDGCSIDISLQGQSVVPDVTVSPDPMAFGFALTQTSATRQLTLTNQSAQAIHLTADPQIVTRNADGSVAATPMFSLGSGGPMDGTAIEARASLSIAVTFAPTETASYAGEVGLSTDDALNPGFLVRLTGIGGGPAISCTPSWIDFGRQAAGIGVTQKVVCTNIGQDVPGHPEGSLFIPDPSASGLGLSLQNQDPAYVATFDPPFPAAGLAAGESATIDVTYNASLEGQDPDVLLIASNDPVTPQTRIALVGSALLLPPCSYEILPDRTLTFGRIQTGTSAVLPFAIVNSGTGDCLANAIQLRSDSNAAFSLPDFPTLTNTGVVIHGGDRLPINVKFAPTVASGSFTGRVDFTISDPAGPNRSIELIGSSLDGCLLIQPSAIDFGVTGYDAANATYCASATRTVTLLNLCASDVVVSSLQLLDLGSPQEFAIQGDPSPVTVPHLCGSYYYCVGSSPVTIQVAFSPTAAGDRLGGLQVVTSDLTDPYLIPLKGSTTQEATRTDQFTGHATAVDVLWVLDTDDDAQAQKTLVDSLTGFLSYPILNGIDFHMATTGTDVYSAPSSEDGRMEPCPGCKVDGQAVTVVSASMGIEAAVTALSPLLMLGSGYDCYSNCNGFASDEQIFESAYEALSPALLGGYNQAFYRPDAYLAVIALDDDSEDDLSNNHSFDFYYNAFIGVKGVANAGKFSFSYLNHFGGSSSLSRMGQMAVLTGGVQADMSHTTTPNWTDELAGLWPKLATEMQGYQLSGTPDTGSIQVSVNGADLPDAVNGTTNWAYDATANSIRFESVAPPQAGDAVQVSYTLACPH